MATDTKKKSESTAEDATSTIKVGSDSGITTPHKPRRLAPLPSGKWKVAIVLVVLLVLVVGALLIHGEVHIGEKIYAQAAGHKIYKKDIQGIKAGNKSVSDHDAATVLADKYLTQAMAQQQNVKVTASDISAAGCPSQKTNPYGYQSCVNQVYFTRLTNNNEGVYKGEFLVANFSRYVPYQSPLLAEQKQFDPKIGDTAAIAADRAYAQHFITDLYNQIHNRKISFDQAIAMEHNDPVVGEKAYPSQTHSGAFDGRISQINFLAAQSIRQKVTSIKPGQLTKPFVVAVSASSTDDSTQDSYFLVVKMDKVSGGHGKISSEQAFQQAKTKLGYKVNV